MKKRLLSCFLALAMALSLLPMSVLAVGDDSIYVKNGDSVTDNNGVTISKTARYKDTNEYEITLSVTTPADVTIPGSSADVVLVIDSSGSMNNSNKMSTAKTSAKNFAQSLFDTEGATVRIAVVDYNSDATVACEWTSDIGTVTSGINAISAGGGTHIQGGIYEARQLLQDSTAANKVIVVISDGEPTYSFRPTKVSGTLDGCFDFLFHNIWSASVKGDSLRFEGFVYNYAEYSYRNRDGGTLGNGNSNSTSWDVNWTCEHRKSGSNKFSYSHAWPTIAEAALAKDGGSEIYSVYLGSLSGVSKTTMEGIATDTSHCFDTQNSDLGALLERIAGSVTSTLAGAITDPMGENIILGDVNDLPGVTKTETGLTWTPTLSQGTENPDGSTTYTVTYPITVDADNLTKDGFLPANGTTTFNYRVGSEDKSLNFNVPQVYGEATKYTVTYEWTDAPGTKVYDTTGKEVTLALPTDSKEYVKGQSYTVDDIYGKNDTVFTHDQYGNVNGKYVFSGWKLGDNVVSGSQIMGDSDVTLTGVWTYTQLDVDILSVTYDWGTTPTDVYDAAGNKVTLTLPTDSEEYVKGQSYTVDDIYGKNDTVFTHDQYGNVNGKYVFSGWKLGGNVVSGSQTMGDSDVTLTGVWTYTEQVVATYSVTYTDGVEDSVIFENEVHDNLVNGAPTPPYNNGATPTREGYEFTGWSPAVAKTVTANATYTAQWEKKEAPAPDLDWDVSRSKTATNLDKNYESQVTLSLPSAEEELASDVVFVLDKSTSAEVETQILSMLQILNKQIENTDATIKVGVVVFNREAHRVLELTELNSENMDAIEDAIAYEISSGTNTHAGLLAGKAMLDEDTSVDSNRKYLIFVSDGITYMYNEEPTVTAWSFLADGWKTWAGPENWSSKYGNTNAPEDWSTWLTDIEAKVSAQGTTYEYPYGGTVSQSTPQENWQTAYANSIDKALYLTYETYQEIQEAGYQCYAVTASSNASYPWATSFMEYLSEGQTVSFEDIQKDIYYLVDAGSYVVDVIGSGTDNKGNAYNFDFVNQAGKLTLKVGEETYSAVSIPAQEGATASYGFNPVDGQHSYVLNYYQNGTEDVASEHFVWEINVPVSNFAHVQLTYSVKLTNPQSRAGTYGQYDADGSEGYTSLYTNTSAVLTPVDSNDVQGPEQIFAKPTVSYTIKKHDGGGDVEPPVLDTENHYGYIVGYDDGTVRPNGKITRAEVATIFFRLLTDESRDAYWCQTNDFSDVSASDWYNNAISTLTNAGILDGYEDGTFRPNGNITRAEFATIAVRFFDLTYEGEDLFPDISDHWARDYINQAAAAGFVNGYEDGTFRPNNAITRAEAVTLVNRTLERKPHKAHLLADMIQWPDNMDQTTWYYADIQEATNSHEYYMTTSEQGEEYEIWTELLPMRDWPALEKEWSDANSSTGADVTR